MANDDWDDESRSTPLDPSDRSLPRRDNDSPTPDNSDDPERLCADSQVAVELGALRVETGRRSRARWG
jgi:hypothetical protein